MYMKKMLKNKANQVLEPNHHHHPNQSQANPNKSEQEREKEEDKKDREKEVLDLIPIQMQDFLESAILR